MAAIERADYATALCLFRRLAEQGNAKAHNVLGVMFRKGEGVPKNPVRAHMWFSFAAKRGEGSARAELSAVILGVRLAGTVATVGLSVGGLLAGVLLVFLGDRLLRQVRQTQRGRADAAATI